MMAPPTAYAGPAHFAHADSVAVFDELGGAGDPVAFLAPKPATAPNTAELKVFAVPAYSAALVTVFLTTLGCSPRNLKDLYQLT